MDEQRKNTLIVKDVPYVQGIHIFHDSDVTTIHLARSRWEVEVLDYSVHIFKAPEEA